MVLVVIHHSLTARKQQSWTELSKHKKAYCPIHVYNSDTAQTDPRLDVDYLLNGYREVSGPSRQIERALIKVYVYIFPYQSFVANCFLDVKKVGRTIDPFAKSDEKVF